MDPVATLLARDQHGVKFGLDGIRTLLDAIGRPERAYPSVIVAGTNGKGSVAAMAAAALTAAGHRTGRYTSPHLVRIEERFAIDGVPVSTEALAAAASRVIDAEARALRQGRLAAPTTFFEVTTATAFEIFRLAGVDMVVLEVGMGGRLDATNVAHPLVAAITSIALDHERFLGSTLAAIAREKAGIVKPGVPVVVGPLDEEAHAVVAEVAAAAPAPLVDAFDGVAWQAATIDGRTCLSLRTPAADYGSIALALRGRHQIANAVVAVRLLELVAGRGVAVSADAIRQGLAGVVWPARLQELTLRDGRRVLVDAAHNPAGAVALAGYLADAGWPPVPLVFGAMRDKDIAGMLRALAPRLSRLVVTAARSPRAMPAGDLRELAAGLGLAVPIEAAPDPSEALAIVLAASPRAVVAGSIFLIGDLLPSLEAMAAPA
jgi:dihydrofolate synthase/folylpolyglutamate synthase